MNKEALSALPACQNAWLPACLTVRTHRIASHRRSELLDSSAPCRHPPTNRTQGGPGQKRQRQPQYLGFWLTAHSPGWHWQRLESECQVTGKCPESAWEMPGSCLGGVWGSALPVCKSQTRAQQTAAPASNWQDQRAGGGQVYGLVDERRRTLWCVPLQTHAVNTAPKHAPTRARWGRKKGLSGWLVSAGRLCTPIGVCWRQWSRSSRGGQRRRKQKRYGDQNSFNKHTDSMPGGSRQLNPEVARGGAREPMQDYLLLKADGCPLPPLLLSDDCE